MARRSFPRHASWTVVLTVLAVELKRLLRDRRALASAILLPALLYPLLFGAHSYLTSMSRDDTQAAVVRVPTGQLFFYLPQQTMYLLCCQQNS